VLLPRISSFQINTAIAKSVKISWLKKSDKDETISYQLETKRPIPLYTLSVGKDTTMFFTKNDVIYVKTYKEFNGKIVSLYNYKSREYNLIGVDDSHIDSIHSVKEYVKTPNGDIYLLYRGRVVENGIHKEGIYNFSKHKIVYESEGPSAWYISYPLANSVAIFMKSNDESSVVYIDIVDLLNEYKYQVSFNPKDYLQMLVKEHSESLLNLVKNKTHKRYIKKLIKQVGIGTSSIKETISPSNIHDDYILDITSSKVVFYKGVTVNMNMQYKVEDVEHSLVIYNPLVMYCSLEDDKLSITLEAGKSLRLKTRSTNIEVNVPSQTLLSKKYRIGKSGKLENSHMYAVSDLFDDYAIIEGELYEIHPNSDNRGYRFNRHGRVSDVLRFEDIINIYQISSDNDARFLAVLRTKVFDKRRRMGKLVVYALLYDVQVIDLDRLYNELTINKYNHEAKDKQYIEVAKYIDGIEYRTLKDSLKVNETCMGSKILLNKYKTYFDKKTDQLYLFFYTNSYDHATRVYITCITIYKYAFGKYNGTWMKVLTLGPYKYRELLIPSNELLPIVMKDIVIAGYNILLYSDLFYSLLSDPTKEDRMFVYNGEIKIRFEFPYIEIVDIIYNRRITFVSEEYKPSVTDDVKQEYNVIFLTWDGSTAMSCKPLVLSEMALVKPITYHA
jgi:hypothetical protein